MPYCTARGATSPNRFDLLPYSHFFPTLFFDYWRLSQTGMGCLYIGDDIPLVPFCPFNAWNHIDSVLLMPILHESLILRQYFAPWYNDLWHKYYSILRVKSDVESHSSLISYNKTRECAYLRSISRLVIELCDRSTCEWRAGGPIITTLLLLDIIKEEN